MPSAKRERQKAARSARQEAMRALQKRRARQRQVIVFVGIVAVTVGLLFIAGILGGSDGDDTTDVAARNREAAECEVRKQTFPEPPASEIDPAKFYTANVQTDAGTFTIELDAKRAPKTVNSFVFLARKAFYDCVTFHRVIKDFVVQGGDPDGTGSGGPGYQFEDEGLADAKYAIGSVAMANSGPNTNGSQFFVVTGTQGASLPPNYTLFGTVKKGMEALRQIETDGGTQANNGTDIKVKHKILKITIEENDEPNAD